MDQERVEQTQKQIEERVEQMRENFSMLETEIHALEAVGVEAALEVSQSIQEVVENVGKSLGEAIQNTGSTWNSELEVVFASSLTQLENMIQMQVQQIEKQLESVNQDFGALHDRLSEMSEAVNTGRLSVSDATSLLEKGVSDLQQETRELAQQLQTQYAGFQSSVEGVVSSNVRETTDEFIDIVSEIAETRAPESLTSVYESIETGQQALSDISRNATQAIQDELTKRLQHLVQHAQEHARRRVEERFQGLTGAAVDALKRELTETIVNTTIGSQITGAMAPILPQMIVLNKAVEGIKGAIDAYKKLKDAISI